MTTIEIARRMAALGERKEAMRAYELVLDADSEPTELLEAALYLLENGGNYRIAYTTFVQLYNAGYFRDRLLTLMKKAFYEPNIKLLKGRYERNCKLLAKYPYLFRKDFLPFDELPLVFFPYDDHNGYVPFDTASGVFRGFVNVKDTVISRNFFKDLEKPILADDVYSQYELEYLVDNVRPSEWVGRENHIYLHYTDWAEFCSWLQVLTLRPLLEDKKLVFLIGDEVSQYPIDFKERFGVDYTKYPVKPFGIREVNRLIFHTQFSSHNGGDFFNEIFDGHPNMLTLDSVLFDSFDETFAIIRQRLREARNLAEAQYMFQLWDNPRLIEEMYHMKNLTDKDLMVIYYLRDNLDNGKLDPAARIVPAIFFQPHFGNIMYDVAADEKGNAIFGSAQAEELHDSKMVQGFKYIKTFTPLRRPTTSYAATVRFMWDWHKSHVKTDEAGVMIDELSMRVTNRSFMRDPEDRLYRDSVIVRFEDGKLNPKATFVALAAFLDVPYTESMTYGSIKGNLDPRGMGEGYDKGFMTGPVYVTYDEYADESERRFIEYFLRDVYAFYGYDFHWYDGTEMTEEKLEEMLAGCKTLYDFIRESWRDMLNEKLGDHMDPESREKEMTELEDARVQQIRESRAATAHILQSSQRYINRRGQPLHMTPMLEPVPELMERERYH